MRKEKLKERKITTKVTERELSYYNIVEIFTKKFVEKMKK